MPSVFLKKSKTSTPPKKFPVYDTELSDTNNLNLGQFVEKIVNNMYIVTFLLGYREGQKYMGEGNIPLF